EALHDELLAETVRQRAGLDPTDAVVIRKRSIDARGRRIQVHVAYEVFSPGDTQDTIRYSLDLPDVSGAPEVHIIGAGPAGLFAALRLIEDGLRPILFERGKDVRARRRDIAAINKDQVVNPDSNYCFGEGGAGTYSDGKLYTRSVKRGDVRRILEVLHVHGAKESILYDAHPHIGTNKLPGIISAMRETILRCGGQIHFETRVEDILAAGGNMTGLVTSKGDRIPVSTLILATGHSARDIFHTLHRNNIAIEAKPFALGVRVEHSQSLIDQSQYHCSGDRGPVLPAAAYSLVQQVKADGRERGVFSFCMCPGGFIVPSATAEGEIVVNGMSPSRRDSRFANSGIVVAVDEHDFKPFADKGPLAGLYFQSAVEQQAFTSGQVAPAQRLEDFIQRRVSDSLLPASYQPGLIPADMHAILPKGIAESLRLAFIE
ncbi:MAG: NAD(P)/FAD-dependent oxidoreductase, partial [Bacteroidota bacterium]